LNKSYGVDNPGSIFQHFCSPPHTNENNFALWGTGTEDTDREAQAHTAIVFLAPLEKYFAALGPDSLAPLSKLHCKNYHL